jgi:hypothetical protein
LDYITDDRSDIWVSRRNVDIDASIHNGPYVAGAGVEVLTAGKNE